MIPYIYISAILLGLIFKRSKLCSGYLMVIMFIVSAFNYMNADYTNYYYGYNSTYSPDVFRYIGYTGFFSIWRNLGLDFGQYRLIFYSLNIILLYISLRMLTNNINYVLAIYLIFAFPLDIVQMKAFFSETLVIFAISLFISYKNNRVINVITVFILILAALIHFSASIYLLITLVFMLYKRIRQYRNVIVIISSSLFIITVSGGLNTILKLASKFGVVSDIDYLIQWTSKNTRYGYILSFILIILILISNYLVYKIQKENCQSNMIDFRISRYINSIVIIIPLIILDSTYDRLIRVFLLLLIIAISRMKFGLKISKKQLYLNMTFYSTIAYTFIVQILPVYTSTLESIFKYNLIL